MPFCDRICVGNYHTRVYSYAILSMSDRISVESVTQEMSQKEITKKERINSNGFSFLLSCLIKRSKFSKAT